MLAETLLKTLLAVIWSSEAMFSQHMSHVLAPYLTRMASCRPVVPSLAMKTGRSDQKPTDRCVRSGSSAGSSQAIFVYSTLKFEAPTYGDEHYPIWAVRVGWALAAVSVLQIPLWAICVLAYYILKGVSHDTSRVKRVISTREEAYHGCWRYTRR